MPSSPQRSAVKQALLEIRTLREQLRRARLERNQPVAVIGIGCRFPGGAHDPESFWRLLRRGDQAIRTVPPESGRGLEGGARRAGLLEPATDFDAEFFGIGAREAAEMDPQQRLLLEVAWEALEHAGYPPPVLKNTRTGVFVGAMNEDHLHQQLSRAPSAETGVGGGSCFLAGRLSYVFGLRGPSLVVNTACSSSLAAVHLACQSLRSGECDLAVAGGVNALLVPEVTLGLVMMQALSPTGVCRPFARDADGYVRGEGCGLVVLKRGSEAEADRDRVHALIRGSAMSHNGPAAGLTVPHGPAQEAVVREALEAASVRPADVGYVEAHGSATVLGDQIEVQSLARVLGEGRPASRPLALGSVKANIGHLESAAGAAALIKTVLCLQQGELMPQPNLAPVNPHLPLSDVPAHVPQERLPWPATEGSRVAGVSAFGFSGTNVHVVVGAPRPVPPPSAHPRPNASEDVPGLLPVSATSGQALRALCVAYAGFLRAAESSAHLLDVCYTASVRRTHHALRRAMVGASVADLATQLSLASEGLDGVPGAVGPTPSARPRVAWFFGDPRSIEPVLDETTLAAAPVSESLRRSQDVLAKTAASRSLEPLLNGEVGGAGPLDGVAGCALQIALAALWRSWGVEPTAVVGAGRGELAAAYVAGAVSLDAALLLASHVGRSDVLRQELARGGSHPPAHSRLPLFGPDSARRYPCQNGDWDSWLRAVEAADARAARAPDPSGVEATMVIDIDPRHASRRIMLDSLAAFYVHGGSVAWPGVYPESGEVVSLPTYPWPRRPDRLDPPPAAERPAGLSLRAARASGPRFGARADRPASGPGIIPAVTERIAELWAEALRVDTVGLDDDFFTLGGDSLTALNLIDSINDEFGSRLTAAAFLRAPTVEGMASRLTVPSSDDATVIPVRPVGDRRPFFCVTPLLGTAFPYFDLALRLDRGQPFFALQPPGLDGRGTPLTTIEGMATHYLEAIRPLQPPGSSYLLGGWSFGALVAYEMARQLQAQGEPVSLVVLMDTPAVPPGQCVSTTRATRFFLTAILPNFLPYVLDYFYMVSRRVMSRRRRRVAAVGRERGEGGGSWPSILGNTQAAQVATRQPSLLQLGDLALGPMVRVFLSNVVALVRYRLLPYPGPVTVLRTPATKGLDPRDERLGWGELAASVDTRPVGGSHMTLLREPHIRSVARELDACLRAAP